MMYIRLPGCYYDIAGLEECKTYGKNQKGMADWAFVRVMAQYCVEQNTANVRDCIWYFKAPPSMFWRPGAYIAGLG